MYVDTPHLIFTLSKNLALGLGLGGYSQDGGNLETARIGIPKAG